MQLHPSKQYYYIANGLYLSTVISFPELLPVKKQSADPVEILYGKVPLNLHDAIYRSESTQISAESVLLDIDGVARFLISKNHVIIDAYDNAEERAIRLNILASVMAVLLHKRDILALHASCVRSGNDAVLISGASGMGKSTTALGLYSKGYDVLNDDISSVFFDDNNTPQVYSGYKHIKLWAESLEKYGYDKEKYEKLRLGLEKYSFPINREQEAHHLPLKAVFFIVAVDDDKINFEKITGLTAFECLRKSTFRRSLIKELGLEHQHFIFCSKLVDKVPTFILYRPKHGAPHVFADYVEELIKEL